MTWVDKLLRRVVMFCFTVLPIIVVWGICETVIEKAAVRTALQEMGRESLRQTEGGASTLAILDQMRQKKVLNSILQGFGLERLHQTEAGLPFNIGQLTFCSVPYQGYNASGWQINVKEKGATVIPSRVIWPTRWENRNFRSLLGELYRRYGGRKGFLEKLKPSTTPLTR